MVSVKSTKGLQVKSLFKTITSATLFFLASSQGIAQTSLNLSELSGTEHGFSFLGINDFDQSGDAVIALDINNDGIDDIVIGASGSDINGSQSGQVYVIYGTSATFQDTTTTLSFLNGTNGFTINGVLGSRIGSSLSQGDINGDDIDDLIIGAPQGNSTGQVFIIFGTATPFASTFEISSINGTNGVTFNGAENFSNFGTSTASGDINGDGIDDVIIGAPFADPNGQTNSGSTYVFFGSSTGISSPINFSGLDGTNGFAIHGISGAGVGDRSGTTVASGDINDDNFYDVIIGAPRHDAIAGSRGEAYVVFGKASGFSASIDLSSLAEADGFSIPGVADNDFTGSAVASADVNNDAIDDLIIGSQNSDNGSSLNNGRVYIVFGSSSSFGSSFNLSTVDGSNGLSLLGSTAGDAIGGRYISHGDINNDGIDDLIFGAEFSDFTSSNAGRTFVYYGKSSGFSTFESISDLDGTNGYALNGELIDDRVSSGLASGDINADGFNDVIIGSAFHDGLGNNRGRTYVFTNIESMSQTVTGDEGFRMLSSPASGTVYQSLLNPFFTQGFSGADDSTFAQDNAWTWDQASQAFVPFSNQMTDSLNAGNGFLFYMFADDNNDGTPEGFPKTLSQSVPGSFVAVSGGNIATNTGAISPDIDISPGEFFLAGNPFNHDLDWDNFTRRDLTNTMYIWSDAASSYQTWNGTVGNITDGLIASFQGFWLEGFDDGAGTNGLLSIPDVTPGSGSATFFKQVEDNSKALKIHAEADGLSTDAWLSFQNGGTVGRDAFDGLALQSFNAKWIHLATIIDTEDVLQINALPINQNEELSFPLELSGSINTDTVVLSFSGLKDFDGWDISILDIQTDSAILLIDEEQVIQLEIEEVNVKEISVPTFPVPTKVKAKTSSTRYQIVLTPNTSVSNENTSELPAFVELQQNYPNPFNPSTTIAFGIPQTGKVTLEVFDVLGRKIATLLNGDRKSAGRYTVNFDARNLASGMYIYRLQAGNVVLIKKLTLIK